MHNFLYAYSEIRTIIFN